MNIIIVPAYNPDNKLINVIKDIKKANIDKTIIVVNDGSKNECNKYFDEIKSEVILLQHEINYGKGKAIKTALNYIKEHNLKGKILTMDSDGQHKMDDGIKLLETLEENKKQLIIGKRCFDQKIPFRSKFGNKLTKFVFRIFSGVKVGDTQSGLRAFNSNLVDDFLYLEGDRFEYEMNVLIYCAKYKIEMKEIDISTIYIDDNKSSHFNVITDSLKIYGTILLFAGSAILSFLLDYLCFIIIYNLSNNIIIANILARIISGSFNFYINSQIVFGQDKITVKHAVQYLLLACIVIILNTIILSFLNKAIQSVAFAKIITEGILFIMNFLIQRLLIFKKDKQRSK